MHIEALHPHWERQTRKSRLHQLSSHHHHTETHCTARAVPFSPKELEELNVTCNPSIGGMGATKETAGQSPRHPDPVFLVYSVAVRVRDPNA